MAFHPMHGILANIPRIPTVSGLQSISEIFVLLVSKVFKGQLASLGLVHIHSVALLILPAQHEIQSSSAQKCD